MNIGISWMANPIGLPGFIVTPWNNILSISLGDNLFPNELLQLLVLYQNHFLIFLLHLVFLS